MPNVGAIWTFLCHVGCGWQSYIFGGTEKPRLKIIFEAWSLGTKCMKDSNYRKPFNRLSPLLRSSKNYIEQFHLWFVQVFVLLAWDTW